MNCGELCKLETDPAEVVNLFDRLEYRNIRQQLVEDLLGYTGCAQDNGDQPVFGRGKERYPPAVTGQVVNPLAQLCRDKAILGFRH